MHITELHPELWQRLQERRGQLPHALLFTGRRGIGKLALAETWIASLLCEQPQSNGLACGHCLACNWLGQGNHPDFRRLQPDALNDADDGKDDKSDKSADDGAPKKGGQQITIEQVRALDDFLHVGTHRQGLRIVLVHPAEAMNRNTANAVLKTLEEPPPDSLFILVTGAADQLLPTIRSRCQRVDVPLPAPVQAEAWLAANGVNDPARWLSLTGGAPLQAQAESGDTDLLQAVLRALSQASQAPLAAATALEKTCKTAAVDQAGVPPLQRLVEWVQKWHHDLLLAAYHQPARYFRQEQKQLDQLARSSDLRQLLGFGKTLLGYRTQSRTTVNVRLFLEGLLQSYAQQFPQPGAAHG